MRHLRLSFIPSSSRALTFVGACALSLSAATASAAQPAPAPAPAPATTTEVAAPSDGSVVVVSSTTTTPAPAVAPAPASAPAPAVVVAPTVEPAPASDPALDRLDAARARKQSEKGRALGLAAAGWSVWGSTYLVSALIGTATIDLGDSEQQRRYGTWMTVPVAGPFMAAFNARSATGTLFTTTLGLAQAAGFTMAIIGTARHRRAKRDLQLMAMPTRGGGHVGVRMRF